VRSRGAWGAGKAGPRAAAPPPRRRPRFPRGRLRPARPPPCRLLARPCTGGMRSHVACAVRRCCVFDHPSPQRRLFSLLSAQEKRRRRVRRKVEQGDRRGTRAPRLRQRAEQPPPLRLAPLRLARGRRVPCGSVRRDPGLHALSRREHVPADRLARPPALAPLRSAALARRERRAAVLA